MSVGRGVRSEDRVVGHTQALVVGPAAAPAGDGGSLVTPLRSGRKWTARVFLIIGIRYSLSSNLDFFF